MSHANGRIVKDGQVIAWYEYDGTCDRCIRQLYLTYEQMWDEWRKPDRYPECSCGKPPINVSIETDYGCRQPDEWTSWNGTACLTCMCIVNDGLADPFSGWST